MRGCAYHEINVKGCRWCDRIRFNLGRRELYAQALGVETTHNVAQDWQVFGEAYGQRLRRSNVGHQHNRVTTVIRTKCCEAPVDLGLVE